MPNPFLIILSPSTKRDLEKLPRQIHNKIINALKQLTNTAKSPHPRIKKLKSKGIGQWRLEMWPYRARYDIVGNEIHIYRIRHRKDIYRN